MINFSRFTRSSSYRAPKSCMFLIFLLAGAHFCWAKSAPRGKLNSIDYYWKTVEEMYREDRLTSSMRLAEEGLRKYPADMKLLRLKAIILKYEEKTGQFTSQQMIEKLNKSEMLRNYKAGIQHYQAKDYPTAIEFLKRSLNLKEDFVPPYFYAEANAMLGVIYQFYEVDKGKAYWYYRSALERDPLTATALKHINQVSTSRKSRNRKR